MTGTLAAIIASVGVILIAVWRAFTAGKASAEDKATARTATEYQRTMESALNADIAHSADDARERLRARDPNVR
jgi:hypothetical protein